MKYEYCAIFYALGTGRGDFNIRPTDVSEEFIDYDAINVLGALGWELIFVTPDATSKKLYLIFKRAIPAWRAVPA